MSNGLCSALLNMSLLMLSGACHAASVRYTLAYGTDVLMLTGSSWQPCRGPGECLCAQSDWWAHAVAVVWGFGLTTEKLSTGALRFSCLDPCRKLQDVA